MRRKYGIIHGMATCKTCGWETGSYKNAQALSAQHARRYGHVVFGEVGFAFTYDGTDVGPTLIVRRKKGDAHRG